MTSVNIVQIDVTTATAVYLQSNQLPDCHLSEALKSQSIGQGAIVMVEWVRLRSEYQYKDNKDDQDQSLRTRLNGCRSQVEIHYYFAPVGTQDTSGT